MHTHTLWAAPVAAGTVLPDKRLPARLACILETFAERPSDAIPQAAGSCRGPPGDLSLVRQTRACCPPPCSRVSPVTRPGSAWTKPPYWWSRTPHH